MNAVDIIEVLSKDNVSIIGGCIIILLTVIQIVPIKWNPWSSLFQWIGKQANSELNTKVTTIETKLDDHIKESMERDVRERRMAILDFANTCMQGRKHTQEEFEFIIHECDLYEQYCDEQSIHNGVADAAIMEIKRVYKLCLQHNSFLTNGVITK